MNKKEFLSLGLMTGTSMDGLDLSLIKTDGYNEFSSIFNKYYEFDEKLHQELISLRQMLKNQGDLKKYFETINSLDREITLFHSKKIRDLINQYNIDLIGFHGQTIFHSSKDRISKQLGNGKLLSQITKTLVVDNFREKDILNNGQGAPLSPIFHKVISGNLKNLNKISLPTNILNIGGISNITKIYEDKNNKKLDFLALDIGPGNCLIDNWIRKNSHKKYDKDGLIAKTGKINYSTLNQAIENFSNISYGESLDVNDFDISFAKGLSFEDGCATLTEFSAHLIAKGIEYINKKDNNFTKNNLVCGGGRKNIFLIDAINKNLNDVKLENIDQYGFDGDFIESQCFGYLAVRRFLNLPISFPSTTGCNIPTIGGTINKNF